MIGLGRLYAVTFKAVTVSAQQDLFYVKPAADKPILLEYCEITVSGGTADAGDAQEELLEIAVRYVPATVTASSGGSSVTPSPMAINDAAAGFTARANDTTKATSSGTITDRLPSGMNNRAGWIWTPRPEHQPIVANAAAAVVRLDTTPADALVMSGLLLVRELP